MKRRQQLGFILLAFMFFMLSMILNSIFIKNEVERQERLKLEKKIKDSLNQIRK